MNNPFRNQGSEKERSNRRVLPAADGDQTSVRIWFDSELNGDGQYVMTNWGIDVDRKSSITSFAPRYTNGGHPDAPKIAIALRHFAECIERNTLTPTLLVAAAASPTGEVELHWKGKGE